MTPLPGSRKFRVGEFVMASTPTGTHLAQVVAPTFATMPHEVRIQVQASGEVFETWQDQCRIAWPKEVDQSG